MANLSIIYITANVIPIKFAQTVVRQLESVTGGNPIFKITQPPTVPRSQAQIYRNVLHGAKKASTKYVAVAEDDVLYSPEHFKFRPKDGHWGYNMNSWNVYTWEKDFFHQKPNGRRNLNGLICERDLLIEHLEERFRLHPDDSKVDIGIFGEPGKYDNQLGTTPYPSEHFYTNPPNIVFSHEANLQFVGLGRRKKVGQIRAVEVPYWGKISDIIELYK